MEAICGPMGCVGVTDQRSVAHLLTGRLIESDAFMNLNISEMKVYVPAKDLGVSKAFYGALGFEVAEAWGGNADCRLGAAVFRLQDYYVKDWAHNFMMQFDVDDARAWYEHAKAAIAGGDFGDARVKEPEMHDGALITHVWDPAGVLLIFIE